MTEHMTESLDRRAERIPTYDSFGDTDEALAWVVDRLRYTMSQDAIHTWWTTPQHNLDDISPELLWEKYPNRVILAATQLS